MPCISTRKAVSLPAENSKENNNFREISFFVWMIEMHRDCPWIVDEVSKSTKNIDLGAGISFLLQVDWLRWR